MQKIGAAIRIYKSLKFLKIMSNFIKIPGTIFSIDWADIGKEIKAIAIDEDGALHGYEEKPVEGTRQFHATVDGKKFFLYDFDRLFLEWQHLCFERPTVSDENIKIAEATADSLIRAIGFEREQERRMIATFICAGMMAGDYGHGTTGMAEWAVKHTDALIQELDKPQ